MKKTSIRKNPLRDMFSTRAHALEPGAQPQPSARLGQREREVLEIVWSEGSGTVEQVSRRLPIQLAYTTVMTTLDRLFKKGLLLREKRDRAFLYSPAVSPSELEGLRARALVDGLFESTPASRDILLSCLVDALGEYDSAMLDELEGKIRTAREQLQPEASRLKGKV